jgi:hypothetical protein
MSGLQRSAWLVLTCSKFYISSSSSSCHVQIINWILLLILTHSSRLPSQVERLRQTASRCRQHRARDSANARHERMRDIAPSIWKKTIRTQAVKQVARTADESGRRSHEINEISKLYINPPIPSAQILTRNRTKRVWDEDLTTPRHSITLRPWLCVSVRLSTTSWRSSTDYRTLLRPRERKRDRKRDNTDFWTLYANLAEGEVSFQQNKKRRRPRDGDVTLKL